MTTQEALFKLLRIALGKEEPSAFPDDVNWQEVYHLSLKQGVGAIACDGLYALPECNIDEDLRYMWLGQSMVIEQKYFQHKKSIERLSYFYKRQGIRMMLLKGFGLSYNYPIPEHRPSGDIDVFLLPNDIGEDNRENIWEKGDAAVSSLLEIKIDNGHEHHTTFQFEGQTVENHYDFVNTKSSRSSRYVESELKTLAYEDASNLIEASGQEICIPSANLNAIFLIRHMGQHFAGAEITLRHLLDWATFIDKYHEEIHWEKVISFWAKMGLYKFVECVNGVCIDKLGLSVSVFHGVVSDDQDLRIRLLSDVLSPEFSNEKPNGSMLRVISFKTRRFFANRWKRRLVYKEGILSQFIMGSWAHLMRFSTIKD